MPLAVSFSVSGMEAALQQIGAIQSRAQNAAPALTIIADALDGHVAQTFASQGQRIGKGWLPLAASTVKARQRRWGYYRNPPTSGVGPSAPIAVWTGRLRSSFHQGGTGHIREISPGTLVWGSGVAYAGYVNARRPLVAFLDAFQERELVFQPLRLWLQGVPAGAIRTVMAQRTGSTPAS